MPRTAEQIKDAILAHQFSNQNYASHIYRLIDEAQRVIFRRVGLRLKETERTYETVGNTQAYELPEDYGSITSIFNHSENPSSRIVQLTDDASFNELEEEHGPPTSYVIRHKSILFSPIPDTTYKLVLTYSKVPSSIVEEHSISPSIADDYYYLIEEYVLSKIFMMEQDMEMSQVHRAEFDKALIAFTGDMNTDRDDSTEYVEGSWEGGYQDEGPW